MTSYPCNRSRVFNACALTLAALTLGACAPVGESRQRQSSLPTDDTDQEHAQFIEALDKFPKLWMPELIRATPLSEMRWLDNRRMVLSVRELPGWKAQPAEPSRTAVSGKSEHAPLDPRSSGPDLAPANELAAP